MPRRNKPHAERRRKTKNYRNRNIRLDNKEEQRLKYKSQDPDYLDEIEEFGWEEYNDRDWNEGRQGR